MNIRHVVYLSFIILLAACAPTSQTPTIDNALAQAEADKQHEIALKEIRSNFERLQKITDKIVLANTDLCGKKVAPFFGFTVSSIDSFPKPYQSMAQKLYGVEKQPTVTYISPKSPAVSKLKKTDLILKINDQSISAGKSGLHKMNAVFSDKKLIDQTVTLTIDRAGKTQNISIVPKAACAAKPVVAQGANINAYADGNNIIVTTGMMEFAKSDNELALVVGHELAHNSRKHIEAKQGNALIGMILGGVITGVTGVNVMGLGSDLGGMAFSQGFEAEADYVGLYHTSRAGYSISNAPNFWRRMGAKNPAGIHLAGTTHPSTAKRFVALENTVKEINSKRSKKQALIPEEKTKEEYKKIVSEYN